MCTSSNLSLIYPLHNSPLVRVHFLKLWQLILLCIYSTRIYAEGDTVFTTPYPQRYQAVNDYIKAGTDPSEDMVRLATLMREARSSGSKKDIRNIERAELVVKQMWHMDTASFFARANDLLQRAEKASDYPIVAFVYETLGDEYYSRSKYVKAFEYYLRAHELYHNRFRHQFPRMAETQKNLALAYYRFGDYTNSLRYSKEVVNSFDPRRAWITVFLQDLVGSSYMKLGMYDSAIVYFRQIFRFAPMYHSASGAKTWHGIASGKIGLALFYERDYEAAIPYLQTGVQECVETGVPDNAGKFAMCLYRIYASRTQQAEMDKYLEVARASVYQSSRLDDYVAYFELMSQRLRKKGDAHGALLYMDSFLFFRDSLNGIIDVNNKHVAELDLLREQRAEADKAAGEERHQLIMARNWLIAFAAVVMILTLMFYNRRLLKQKLHRQQLEADKHIAETELASAAAQLGAIKKNLEEKNDLLSQLETERETVHDPGIIDRLQQSTILTDEQWDDFRKLFEKAHPGFMARLKEKLPALSPAEVRFMVLARLNYSNKEMAATLGVSAQAMRTTWYRLRKKLDLPEEGKVEELLRELE